MRANASGWVPITGWPCGIPRPIAGACGNQEMALAPDGAVWVLCYPGGLTRFDPATLTPEKIPTPESFPTGIHMGPDGRIWIANSQYVKAARPSQRPFHFVDVPLPPEIHQGIGRFASAGDGVLWAVGR